ncbi:MAG TPA: hypothetical protein VFX20_12670 [Steroidobacteraceae bacterium]|nr:hypothetical protein [Steroidobacteraceae bacterium]
MTENPGIEVSEKDGKLLAIVIRRTATAAATQFITPTGCSQQLGFVVYKSGTSIPRHEHLPVSRSLIGTTEVVFVREGRCTVDIFDSNRELFRQFDLGPGDAIFLNGGGHGFRVHEDTVLFEVKQGPFTSGPEKVRF